MIKTVPSSGDVTVTTYADLTHLCPFVDEVDRGTVKLTWRVDGQTLELHSVRAYLDGFATSRLSHEEVTNRIGHDIASIPGVELIEVTTAWDTAGMEVTCATSPTRQAQRSAQP